MNQIRDDASLRSHFGSVSPLAETKELSRLDHYCRDFIALAPFVVLASSDGNGAVDASPRGDAPGFVRVLDDQTMLLPDRPGNRRVDSFHNILASSGIGLLFMVPGISETLRVNGTARLVTEIDLLAKSAAHGKIPTAGLLITVKQAFFHCGKALIRSRLWEPATQVPRASFPTLGRIAADQTKVMSAEEAEALVEMAYRDKLY